MYDWLVALFFPSGAPAGLDLDDPEQCVEAALAAATAELPDDDHEAARARLATRRVVATQLLAGDPAELLDAAQLLMSEGRSPRQTWVALDLAFKDAAEYSSDPDRVMECFRDNLELLPLPDEHEIAAAYLEMATSPIPLDDLDEAVGHQLAVDLEVPMVRSVVEDVQDRLLTDGSLTLLTGDLAVVPERLLSGVVLTTRVRRAGELVLDADLAPFDLLPDPEETTAGDAVDVTMRSDGLLVWQGPSNWLSDIPPGTMIAVRRDGPRVAVEPLEPPDAPELDPGLVDAIAAAYEEDADEVGLPVSVADLLLELQAADPRWFNRITAPLSELCAAAGLEVRGTSVGRGRGVWARRRWSRLLNETYELFGPEDRERPLDLIKLMGRPAHDEQPSTEEVRAGLTALADPDLTLDLIRLLDDQEAPEATEDLVALAEVLRPVATRARPRAAVTWLRARVVARSGDPEQAESLLRDVLLDDPDNANVIEELAWYASDRGDAEKARSLWLQLSEPPQADLALLPQPSTGSPKLRRNELCWCGSGRKYKACHLRIGERPPLPDRFHWMMRKLFSFFERQGAAAARDLARAAWLLERLGEQAIEEVWSDPVALDVVLFDFGWLDRFLAARGPLLPDDERLLYASWQLRGRSLYEVTEANPTAGTARLRDLRTGDEEELRDRMFSASTRPGTVICARLLDDGERKQLCDGGFDVPTGREGALLELLDLEDSQERGEALLSWFAARSRPPMLQPREEEREPFSFDDLATSSPPAFDLTGTRPKPSESEERAILQEVVETQELRWCAESVPALDGLTPREAAADPTRREQLERLIASMPEGGNPLGYATMRPARLRELLGMT